MRGVRATLLNYSLAQWMNSCAGVNLPPSWVSVLMNGETEKLDFESDY